MEEVPLSEAKFLDWLEPYMDQRMVPPDDAEAEHVAKFNENHDEQGRFASSYGTEGGKTISQSAEVAGALMRDKRAEGFEASITMHGSDDKRGARPWFEVTWSKPKTPAADGESTPDSPASS